MRHLRCLAVVLVSAGVCLRGAPQPATYDFDRHTFSLDLPGGYTFQGDQSPRPGFKTFGFSTDPRQDGTRGLIQVSLVDLSTAPPGEKVTVDRFADAMIKGVSERRTHWEQKDSE